jgi:hypothetical protein
MACEFFVAKRFRTAGRELIDQCNTIIADYLEQGLRLTLRQLYYQCVVRNLFPNEEKSYRNLGSLLNDARLAGLVDWAAIEDRVRQPRKASEWSSIASLVEAALYAYRLPRWSDQPVYAELWVEKDALAGVLEPIAHEFHVTLMVNRGYSSASAMYEASKRFIRADRPSHLFYLGDHDPSGEDMVRDVRDRLERFGVQDLTVQKIAITMAQVGKYNPPPNPAKMSDSRARAYVEKYGQVSWEVDALPPDVLAQIVRDALEDVVDRDAMKRVEEQEARDKTRLRKAVEELMQEDE